MERIKLSVALQGGKALIRASIHLVSAVFLVEHSSPWFVPSALTFTFIDCLVFSFLSCPPNPSSSVQLLLDFSPLINWASIQAFRHSSYCCAMKPSKHESSSMFEALKTLCFA